MSLTRWFRGAQSQAQPPTNQRTKRPRWLRNALLLEKLEDRLAPTISPVSFTDPTMISDTAAGNAQQAPSVSKDGRFVVYTNSAANLVPGQVMDSKTASDVF